MVHYIYLDSCISLGHVVVQYVIWVLHKYIHIAK